MTFDLNQTFDDTYPPEAAIWCNQHEAVIEKVGTQYIIRALTPPSTEEKALLLRQKRNLMLAETDKYMIEDFPISEDLKSALKSYRQTLRDITLQNGFPDHVVFPQMP